MSALLAQTTETVLLDTLSFQRSADVLVILILGGAGRLYGVIIGAIIYMVRATSSPASTCNTGTSWIGALLVAVVIFLPNGILGGLARLRRSGGAARERAGAVHARAGQELRLPGRRPDIALDLPQGERYALIGLNGAGKTTLINLITGMISPTAARSSSQATSRPRRLLEQRVKRGLVRTFQINSLFPHLNALEAVTLVVCERRGYAGTWWRALPAYSDAIEEAYAILPRCGSPRAAIGRRMSSPTPAAAARDRACTGHQAEGALLDEPAAGVPQRERRAVPGDRRPLLDIAVLFIEHDMNVVFRFANRIIVMVGGRILVWDAAGDRRRRARARGLPGRDAPWLRRCWRSRTCVPATEKRSCSTASRSRCRSAEASRRSAATASASPRSCSPSWATPTSYAAPSRRATTSPACRRTGRPRRAGLGGARREIFASLDVEENLTVASRPGRWDLAAVYGLFPRLEERRGSRGNHLSGGEQQMLAIARADDQSRPAPARRAARGSGADHRRGTDRGDPANDRRSGTAFILVEQHAEVALSPPRTPSCWSAAPSCTAPGREICLPIT